MHKQCIVEIIRGITQGAAEHAQAILKQSKGDSGFNTASIERLNATFRERLATLTRRCRHAAYRVEALEIGRYLIGGLYNFCVAHDELSSSKHFWVPTTPAMAAGLTTRVWSVKDVLLFKAAPSVWTEPKRRGRPHAEANGIRKHPSARPVHLHPLLRLRKRALHAVTS